MLNKFINLFVKETRFGLRMVIIVILAFLSAYSWNKVSLESMELKKTEREKMLIASITSMEQELKLMESNKMLNKAELSEALPAINGIWVQDNSPVALVGDNFLKEGDSIGQFIISKITEHKVVLTNKLTSLNKEINF